MEDIIWKILNTKKTPIKESILSKSPPCPGIIVPLSFTSAFLLTMEAIMSPKKAEKIITITKKIEVSDK